MKLGFIEKKGYLNTRYEGYQGLFVKDGTLCYKPEENSNFCYEIGSGKNFEYANELVHRAYFEGGTRGIKLYNQVHKDRNREEKSHPSYGLISFNRIKYGEAKSLFGSSIKHENPIQMILSHAVAERNINQDYYCEKGRIVEVEMSQSQFADLITSFNNSSGTPCTVKFTERDGNTSECDYVNKVEQFQKEFSYDLSEIRNDLDKIIESVKEIFENRKTLKKSDKEEILSILNNVRRTIGNNADYVLNSFNEQIDKTITEAKGEIESFMYSRIHELAKEAIGEKINREEFKIENPIKLE